MIKEPPILVVNKEKKQTERKKRKTTSNRPQTRTKRKLSSRKKSFGLSEKLRWWGHYVLMGVAAVLFVALFYYLFIRPLFLPLETLLWHEGIRNLSALWVSGSWF